MVRVSKPAIALASGKGTSFSTTLFNTSSFQALTTVAPSLASARARLHGVELGLGVGRLARGNEEIMGVRRRHGVGFLAGFGDDGADERVHVAIPNRGGVDRRVGARAGDEHVAVAAGPMFAEPP